MNVILILGKKYILGRICLYFWGFGEKLNYIYRPKEGDTESIIELRRSLDMAAQLKGNLWLLEDFNYPKFSWDKEHMPTMKSGTGFPAPYEDFVSLLMIPLFKRANWTGFQSYMAEKKTEILNNLHQQSVESIWTAFKTALQRVFQNLSRTRKLVPKKACPG